MDVRIRCKNSHLKKDGLASRLTIRKARKNLPLAMSPAKTYLSWKRGVGEREVFSILYRHVPLSRGASLRFFGFRYGARSVCVHRRYAEETPVRLLG